MRARTIYASIVLLHFELYIFAQNKVIALFFTNQIQVIFSCILFIVVSRQFTAICHKQYALNPVLLYFIRVIKTSCYFIVDAISQLQSVP